MARAGCAIRRRVGSGCFTVTSNERTLWWSPTLIWVVRGVTCYGCTLCFLPVTQVRCDELTDRFDVRAYTRSGMRELETFVQDAR